jgi:site-specific DNA-cytosine methylase
LRFTICHLFSGIGGSALGAAAAESRFGDHTATFETVGGIDLDRQACEDFERLTGAPALCADMHGLEPAALRAAWGAVAPDAVLASPPCKGFSGLLSKKRAAEEKYQRMNSLLLRSLFLLCSTWPTPPALIFFENVPRIATRGREMVERARQLLEAHGYVVHVGSHDCGELGGLAQHRRRWFLLARHRARVPQLVYQPPTQRVRACGEVLGPLPMPGDVAAGGPMHSLPRLSWRNWVRLALIPAGGDWRDLPGVVPEGKARRDIHRRQAVADWAEPAATVTGPGGSAAENVADPRAQLALGDSPDRHWNKYSVGAWDEPARTIIGAVQPGSGGPAVADPRYSNILHVTGWEDPARTVVGASRPGGGAPSVADPRPAWQHVAGVTPWSEPAPTITGQAKIHTGAFQVADPRVKDWGGGPYGVRGWGQPVGTVTGESRPSNGTNSVADPRLGCAPRAGAYRVLRWDEAAATITGSLAVDNGPAAVADPRIDPDKPPPFTPIIIAADGTWHRPLTTLELAALQGFPVRIGDEPLVLAGRSHTRWREAIGNAVPPPAARAVAEQLLLCLLVSHLGAFALSRHDVWVQPEEAA